MSTYMLRKHLAGIEAAKRPEAVAERKASAAAWRRAVTEGKLKFPTITAENFEHAEAYQSERAAYWIAHAKKAGDENA
jgi:hypothetical protein